MLTWREWRGNSLALDDAVHKGGRRRAFSLREVRRVFPADVDLGKQDWIGLD